MDFVYIVYLWGKHVFTGLSNVCVITEYNEHNVINIRSLLKKRYNLEFGDISRDFDGQWSALNITDYRDIKLIIERVNVVDANV